MTDLPYVAAAYGVVIATLVWYVLSLRGRLERARRRVDIVAAARPVEEVRSDEPTPEAH